jgi:hypothetical protein
MNQKMFSGLLGLNLTRMTILIILRNNWSYTFPKLVISAELLCQYTCAINYFLINKINTNTKLESGHRSIRNENKILLKRSATKPVGLAGVKHVETLLSWPTLPVQSKVGTSSLQRRNISCIKTGPWRFARCFMFWNLSFHCACPCFVSHTISDSQSKH